MPSGLERLDSKYMTRVMHSWGVFAPNRPNNVAQPDKVVRADRQTTSAAAFFTIRMTKTIQNTRVVAPPDPAPRDRTCATDSKIPVSGLRISSLRFVGVKFSAADNGRAGLAQFTVR